MHLASIRGSGSGADESFNGKLRDECLSMEYFRSRPEAIATIETWPVFEISPPEWLAESEAERRGRAAHRQDPQRVRWPNASRAGLTECHANLALTRNRRPG